MSDNQIDKQLDHNAVVIIRKKLRKFIERETKRTEDDFDNDIINSNQQFKILQSLKSLNEFILHLDIAVGKLILTDIEKPKLKIEAAIEKIEKANQKLKKKSQMFASLAKLIDVITSIVGVIGVSGSSVALISGSLGIIDSIVKATNSNEEDTEEDAQ